MKFKLITLSLLLASAAMQSCSDDELEKGKPLEAGAEIEFGASLPDEVLSRTYYGPETVDGTHTIWPIYWNYQDTKDQIFIYSPQALAGRNQATYQVMATEENCKSAVSIQKVGNAGIQAGNDTGADYSFYAMYPASAVKGEATGTTINGTLAGAQYVTLDATTADAAAKIMKPDMNNCLMVGTGGPVKLTEGDKVGIQFKPFVTALDITVNGPASSTNVEITSIIISTTSNGYLNGDFAYDFSGNGTLTVNGANRSKSVTVYTRDGQGNGITLGNGQSMNLQAFILPDANVTDLKVRVVAANSQYWEKTLNMAGTNVDASNILKVKLDRINMGNVAFDYSVWLSQLDTRTYISEISLPGSALSWNTSAFGVTDSYYQTQTATIPQQFAAGIRVFQAHCWPNKEESQIVPGSPSLHLVAATKNSAVDTGRQLSQAVKVLTDELAENHANEFCVLMLSDYSTGAQKDDGTAFTATDFYKLVRIISDKLAEDELLATNVGPNTTIEDVKGKVILMIKLNTNSTEGWQELEGSKVLFSTFGSGATSGVWYSQLMYGTTSGLATGGTGASSSVSTWPMSFIYSEEANPVNNLGYLSSTITTALKNSINAYKSAYTNYKPKVFGMSYLGGNGYSSIGRITPTQVTETLISTWNSTWGTNTDQPYGWVMFNQVGGSNTTINNAIAKVIEQNARDLKKADAPKAAPAGDMVGTKAGGSLFGN